MSKDKFEIQIGKQLRGYEVSVPADAWANIQAQIKNEPTTPPGSSGLNWLPSAIGAVIILGGLSWYSAVKDVDHRERTTVVQEKLINQFVADSESETDNQTADETSSIKTFSDKSSMETNELSGDEDLNDSQVLSDSRSDLLTETVWSAEEIFPEKASLQKIKPLIVQKEETVVRLRNSKEVKETIEKLRNASTWMPEGASASEINIQASQKRGYAPLQVKFSTNASANNYVWDFGDGTSFKGGSFNKTFEEPGFYTVHVTEEVPTGIGSTQIIEVEVLEPSKLYVPDSFTPNSDGVNDSYKVEGVDIEEFSMQIFDPNGEIVFQTNDMATFWNPDIYQLRQSSKAGSYVVKVEALGVDGKPHRISKKLNVIY